MSGYAYDRQPLADDIFGNSALTPDVGYNDAAQATEPGVLYPEYAPQPLGGGEPKQFATIAGHEDKPIFVYPDGRKVVRVPRLAPGSAPVNELPRAVVAETVNPVPVAPVKSFSFKMEQSSDGRLSGDFDFKGDLINLLGGLAGSAAANNRTVAQARQLESRIVPTQPVPQRAVVSRPLSLNEAPNSESDDDWSSSETATFANRGLKKVIKAVFRPRLAGAVLALSVAAAGGAYRLESGELPIHGNPIEIIQADYNQVINHPLQTIAAQIGKL